ncbi:MAG TPA: hypothetical protein VLX92_09520 [Kofleriaceae bacterium]|nr:hypothetical protein [Kofleriaceae bacterium]
MRRTVALAALAALASCNQIFGLKHTRQVDATPDVVPDAPFQTVSLDWQIPQTDSSGAPIPTPAYAVITPAPHVQLAAVGDPLQDATYAANGSVDIPNELVGKPWRFVYTLDGDPVPHEVQWSVSSAHLVVPRLSPAPAPAVPTGSGYDIMPIGIANPGLIAPFILTSGTYTETAVANDQRGPDGVTFDFLGLGMDSPAQPIYGPLGAPQTASGDWELLIDTSNLDLNGGYTTNGWAYTQIDLAAGSLTTPSPQPQWHSGTMTFEPKGDLAAAGTRVDNACRTPGGVPGPEELRYGIGLASNVLPMAQTATGVDKPLMLVLFQQSTPPVDVTLADPDNEVQQPRWLFSEAEWNRTVNGASISCTVQNLQADKSADRAFEAPLAQMSSVFFGTASLTTADLLPVPATSAQVELKWQLDQGLADDWIVTVYEIASSKLTAIRTYQVTQPSVLIDGSLLQRGHTYIFGITGRNGIANAASGDYTAITMPFSEGTAFPAAIVMQ